MIAWNRQKSYFNILLSRTSDSNALLKSKHYEAVPFKIRNPSTLQIHDSYMGEVYTTCWHFNFYILYEAGRVIVFDKNKNRWRHYLSQANGTKITDKNPFQLKSRDSSWYGHQSTTFVRHLHRKFYFISYQEIKKKGGSDFSLVKLDKSIARDVTKMTIHISADTSDVKVEDNKITTKGQ